MRKNERRKLAQYISERIDDLDLGLDYRMFDYHNSDASVICADIDIRSGDDNTPEDFDEQLEDLFEEIVDEWGGWYSWDGWCISIAIPDDED